MKREGVGTWLGGLGDLSWCLTEGEGVNAPYGTTKPKCGRLRTFFGHTALRFMMVVLVWVVWAVQLHMCDCASERGAPWKATSPSPTL